MFTQPEIVKSEWNQDYGAFELRKNYSGNMDAAILICICLIALLAGFNLLHFHTRSVPKETLINDKVVELHSLFTPKAASLPAAEKVVAQGLKKPAFSFNKLVEKDIETTDGESKSGTSQPLEQENTSSLNQEAAGEGLLTGGASKDLNLPAEDKIYLAAEIQVPPVFPGGESGLMRFLHNHINYPALAREEGAEGTIYLSFIVDPFGKVTNVQVLKGIGFGCDEEGLRVITSMPDWTPGKQNGRAIPVKFVIPLRFTLK